MKLGIGKPVYSRLNEIPDGKTSDKFIEGCLVVEGGGFRGSYNQGVLDALMLNDINLRTVIGVSAGALASTNYVSGQIGRSARATLKYRHCSEYIGFKALRRSFSLINLDFLLETYDEIEPFDSKRFFDPQRRFVAVTTNCLTGRTQYYEKGKTDYIFEAVKASASLPLLSPMVDVGGTPSLDGGCSCKIAYQWALDEGFEKIIIIKTRERGFRKPIKGIGRLSKKFYRKYPDFLKSLSESDLNYNLQCDRIDELEDEGRVYVIAPSERVGVGRLESDVEKLGDLYFLGLNDGLRQIEEIKGYLGIE